MIKIVTQNVVQRYPVLVQFAVSRRAVYLHNITQGITDIEEDIHIIKGDIDIQNTVDIMNIDIIKILLENKKFVSRYISKHV